MSCGCNVFNEYPSGGLIAGGSAVIYLETVEGGCIAGGSARVEVYQDAYDGLEFILPLDESGNVYFDRTKNHLDGSGAGIYDPDIADGVFCSPAADFDGDIRQYISIPQDSIGANQSFTVSCWIKIDTMFKTRRIYSRGFDDGTDQWVFNLGYSFINHLVAGVNSSDGTTDTNNEAYSSETMSQDRFYHISSVFDGDLKVYINGVLSGENDIIDDPLIDVNTGGYIGRFNGGAFHSGLIQELRLHPTAKTAGWLLAEHDNYCASGFYTVGDEEEL